MYAFHSFLIKGLVACAMAKEPGLLTSRYLRILNICKLFGRFVTLPAHYDEEILVSRNVIAPVRKPSDLVNEKSRSSKFEVLAE